MNIQLYPEFKFKTDDHIMIPLSVEADIHVIHDFFNVIPGCSPDYGKDFIKIIEDKHRFFVQMLPSLKPLKRN